METVGVIEQLPQRTAAVRQVIPMGEIAAIFPTAIERVLQHLAAAGLAPVGAPFARYRGHAGGTFDVELGFPVPEGAGEVPELVMGELPGVRAVEAVHVGDYESLRDTYAKIEAWAAEHRVALREETWEIYDAGPSSDPDPATWRTRLVWPVADPWLGSAPAPTESSR